MRTQPNRLGIEVPHPLHGSAIDRSQTLQFRLDGRIIGGFAGDTVLSAALAAGIDTLGRRNGMPLALSARHAPTISLAGQQSALPMERTLASDGADYVTLARKAARRPLARLLRRDRRSLGLDLDRSDASARPWLGLPGETGPLSDLVVVGGGLAGMAAALAAAKRGKRVVLIEATPRLGGAARLFGTQDSEETPDAAVTRLIAAIAKTDTITVLTSAEVFALRSGVVRLHQVELRDGASVGRVIEIAAPAIVLATGALERLPVFSGNRLPGTSGALEAFMLAQLYGVWPGKSVIIATSSSPAYRLAMLARDAGIEVPRIIDSRPQPQSRFIEFSKAYGITQAAGTIPASAIPAAKGKGLVVTPQLALEGFSQAEPALAVDRLIVCGGWQPDLTLWHMAGGHSAWSPTSAGLQPTSGPSGIALAGNAAGWLSSRACLASGGDAVHALLGCDRKLVEELLIDPIYETPDAAAPIGDVGDEAAHPAFLDAGWRYIERPAPVASRWPGWLPFAPKPAGWSLADTPQPLGIADIAAGVQLGAIPPSNAGIVAQERVAMVVIEHAPDEDIVPAPPPLVPPYLHDRHPGAALWLVTPDEARVLDVGALIYANADQTDPLQAIGVIVRGNNGEAVALATGSAGQPASVREPGRAIGIRLVSIWRAVE